MTTSEAAKILEEAAMRVGEHFDAVQILATWNEQGETRSLNRGTGNWYARQGLAHAFINFDANQDAAVQIAAQLKQE